MDLQFCSTIVVNIVLLFSTTVVITVLLFVSGWRYGYSCSYWYIFSQRILVSKYCISAYIYGEDQSHISNT